MTSLLKNNTERGTDFSERAGLIGYTDREISEAVEASRKAVADGKVTPARKAYANFRARRNALRA